MSIHVFGIRHHGPGSARSLKAALEALEPDIVLIEGPPDADALLELAAHPEMRPPVALVVYAPEEPAHAVYYPFATFSPEWQALRYALARGIPARFMDLPQTHRLAMRGEEPAPSTPATSEDPSSGPQSSSSGPQSSSSGPQSSSSGPQSSSSGPQSSSSGPQSSSSGPQSSSSGPRSSSSGPQSSSSGPQSSSSGPQSYSSGPRSSSSGPRSSSSGPQSSSSGPQSSSSGPRPFSSADSGAPASTDNGLEAVLSPEGVRADPIGALALAAGFEDRERWWEYMVEHRHDGSDLFAGILEAMTALREAGTTHRPDAPAPDTVPVENRLEALREAWMRQTIRLAQKEGFQRIAVVCGAWHAPALVTLPPAKADAALLKGLPKQKVEVTWIPWTYGRLTFHSGYGAGIESPGWYQHLWDHPDQAAIRWMSRVARLLREEDLDISSAHVIEAVRLAEAVAALRGLPIPGLRELNEAAQTVLCFGADTPLRLIHQKLVVGEVLGAIPDETPMVPLQLDLARHQKRLKLPPDAVEKLYDLDLRKANDLERSHLLHRLELLGVPWGRPEQARNKLGTFHELWKLQWQPELAMAVVEAAQWGNTVVDAATARTRDAADRAADLPALSRLADRALLAGLPGAIDQVMSRLEAAAAVAADIGHLMDALPPLARVMRYGNVRQTDRSLVGHVVDGLVARVAVGLPNACASLDDEAATAMLERIISVHGALSLVQRDDLQASWCDALRQLSGREGPHGLIAGHATRLLLDGGSLDSGEAARRLSVALSPAVDPPRSAAWIEGFLRGSGLLLLHDDALWEVIDAWVGALNPDTFTALLPLLRRTFSHFSGPERRQLGERAKAGKRRAGPGEEARLDEARAAAVLPLLTLLLGPKPEVDHAAR